MGSSCARRLLKSYSVRSIPQANSPSPGRNGIENNPAFATFPMPLNQHPPGITYSEGIFVGYRGYEHNNIQPQYPFGFGLSYMCLVTPI